MSKKTTIDVNVPFDIATGQLTKTAANRQNDLMRLLSDQYATLSDSQKAQWNLRNNMVPTAENPGGLKLYGINGWSAFYACNVALLGASQPIVHTPAPRALPVNLPAIRVNITYTGVGNTPVITLIPNNAYAAGPTIALSATAPVPLGNGGLTVFKAKSYHQIGTITGGILAAGVNVAPQFLSLFQSVPASCKIGFKLQAVNPGGYHSVQLFTVGLTPMLSLEAMDEGTDDANLHLAAGA